MNTKKALYLLGAVDLLLVIMHFTDYFFLFLKPTGYIFPLTVNFLVLAAVAYRSTQLRKRVSIVGMIVILPVLLFHSFMVMLWDYSYTKIDSPWNKQSIMIEYRLFSLGESTYQYHFYKTRFGIVGKLLDEQSITMVIQGTEHPGLEAEEILGVDRAEWVTENTIRFPAWQGMKEVHLGNFNSARSEKEIIEATEEEMIEEIEGFIEKVENQEDGHTIFVNGNRLVTRYDEAADESWIEVTSEGEQAPIPRQQCSRIVPDEERGYYMMEECTHRWEYPLFPLESS
ncbi:hypothetical protein [Mesobacillus subterraneus]|uniref:hypothetical protein n=1 Tax=Mesobacillus subterraneus TaxID=285983 RepID=UPI001CFF15A7|nr:hypothetical protein [Mesobacillus subterraneus]